MKKKAALLLLFVISVMMITAFGCTKKKTEPKKKVKKAKVEKIKKEEQKEPEAEPENHDNDMISVLTGEWIAKEIGIRRPAAVMLNNAKAACPQTGISKAGVIYEAPVEGGECRLMGIFEDYNGLTKIGSVRSCRTYYVYYAKEFDAIYAHYGQAAYALPYLDNIDNLNGLDAVGSAVYYRSHDRKAPHNAYTNFDGLSRGISQKKYRTNYEENHIPHYKTAALDSPVELTGGAAASYVKPGYKVNKPWFEYDESTKLYKRFQYGTEHIDNMNNEQLTCKNIILQYSKWSMYDENYLNINTTSGGAGKYITNGKAIDVTWKKESEWAPTKYYDSTGNEITLNPGRTWVCIVQNTLANQVVISEEKPNS